MWGHDIFVQDKLHTTFPHLWGHDIFVQDKLHTTFPHLWGHDVIVLDKLHTTFPHLWGHDVLILDGQHLTQLQSRPSHATQRIGQPLCVALREVGRVQGLLTVTLWFVLTHTQTHTQTHRLRMSIQGCTYVTVHTRGGVCTPLGYVHECACKGARVSTESSSCPALLFVIRGGKGTGTFPTDPVV